MQDPQGFEPAPARLPADNMSARNTMRILREAISERLLPFVRRPAQYLGLEWNRRCGDVRSAEVTVALCFPDAYEVGISHVGTQILYTLLNAIPGVAADRAYCPLPDAEAAMRRNGVPLFAWESRAAVTDFDLVGMSLSYELTMTNVLTMLDLAGMPLHAAERTDGHPIVVAGGTQADAPEVMADFIDVFLVGDGEVPLAALVELVRRMKRAGARREEVLLEAARTIPAAYVPAFWEPRYAPGGTLASLRPTRDGVPDRVRRSCVSLADSPPITHPLVPVSEGVFDRVSIEVMRGCPNACRFCHAGYTKKPVRWRTVDELLDVARQAIDSTGCREISLLSLSTSDHPQLPDLVRRMNEQFAPRHVSVSLPSLRVDETLQHLPWQLNEVRKSGLTVAVEAASERLRLALRKRVTEEDLLRGVTAAYAAGWKSVKVYFMAGFPGETDDDIRGIAELCRRISLARKGVDGHKGAVTASVSWLVPKPHTALQWAPQQDAEYFWHVRTILRELTHRSPVTVKCHRIERSVLEGVVARGDRRVGRAIEAAWRLGARFDGWDEHWNWDLWQRALEQAGLDIAFYTRARQVDEPLPWDMIADHRPRHLLAAEWEDFRATMGV